MGTTLFRRPPRLPVPPLPRGELALESPPELAEPLARNALQYLMLLPMLGGGGAMALMYSTRGGGALTYVVGAMFGVSMLGMAVTSFASGQGNKKAEVDARRREYLRYLAQSRRQVRRAASQQRTALLWRHPAPDALWSVPVSGRMWERRSSDNDFGEVRVAEGAQRLSVAITAPETRPVEDLEPLTAIALRQFVRTHSAVPELPLAIQLRAFSRVLLRGERDAILGLTRAMICQFATFHSPDDARVAVVAAPEHIDDWDWVKWLPHAQDERNSDGAGSVRLFYTSMGDLEAALGEEVSGRPQHSPDAMPLTGSPHLLVVLDGGEVPVASLLQGAGVHGSTVLDLAGAVPHDAGRWLLTLDVAEEMVTADRGERSTPLGRPDRLSVEQASGIARGLAPYRLSRYVSDTVEATARVMELPDLLGFGDAAAVDPEVSWRRRAPRDRLRIPLGVAPNGSAVELDLKEAAFGGMGPHGLVIGATGSGKSELLRTLVTSLAVTHASDDLNFVLVDFKGGATFASMDVLPHVSAVITNLADELSMVDRMQDAISGELVRRQELLRAAGNYVSRHEYELARQAGEPLRPLPSLLIICDEFSELLAEKPDFIDLFVMIGRLGRSLGVHLLLASQQLEEGRLRGLDTHLSYRIGLRTFSAMESRIVLGVPDAYELPNAPGHGYLKVGTQTMQRFRAAYVSGPYREQSPFRRLSAVNGAARIVPYSVGYVPEQQVVEPEAMEPGSEQDTGRSVSMLDVIIGRLRGHGVPAHQVWLPVLDQAPPLDMLLGNLVTDERTGLIAPAWRQGYRLVAPVGIEDRPFEQRRDPLVVNLSGATGNVAIVGGPRAGKSTLLRTLIASLALTHSPREVQFMCIDLGGGALRALQDLPHVSGVALRRDVEALRRTVAEVSALVEDREARFAAAGVASIDEYRDRRAAGEFADDPFGDVFLIVDGYGLIREEHDDLDEIITSLLSRCLGFGVHIVVTASRWGEIRYNIREFYGTKLELRLGDPSDSEIDRRTAVNVPLSSPGRGISPERMHFLVGVPRIDGTEGDDGLTEATANLVTRSRAAWPHAPAPRVRLLPRNLAAHELSESADRPAPAIPIGVNETYLAPVYLAPDDEPHLMIFGDAASGKTNLLRLIARGIVERNTPDEAMLVIVDYRRTLLDVVTGQQLLRYAPSAQVAQEVMDELAAALAERLPGPDVTSEQLRTHSWWKGPDIYVLVDDYDLVAGSSGNNPIAALADLLAQARDIGVHLVVARRSGGAGRASYDAVLGKLQELDMPGLVMSGNPQEGAIVGNVRPTPQPAGRGVLVRRSDGINLIQTAWLEPVAWPAT
ncbi:type VII secretion protein EccCa [Rugosimonospora acidiphila]|uniref:type VII secretion protein EccCa n=1 Tax=Rugosimonospora acidiphila TaxID=556531 RepID=UPI0031E9972B